ncbi:ThiF family adenylyltransferase [Micromonospora chalcea]
MNRLSAAMTADLDAEARDHLLRTDGQEDVCLALYAPSTGLTRTTAALSRLVLPQPGERSVHGNASFAGQYVVRAASEAAKNGLGIALMHSHPTGTGWQSMSGTDHDTEKSYAHVAQTITGLPLLGMTVAGDAGWSARFWQEDGGHRDAENVRVAGPALRLSWNDAIRPAPTPTAAQVRTVSAWGDAVQASIARLRVLVVGVGTVGLDLAIRLVQAGIQHVSVMDFDTVEVLNLDRLITASRLDAALLRSKVYVALRAMRAASTAATPTLNGHELSICEPAGLSVALDYDVIFSCVDRPWARAVLNQIAYTDLIPVIDGGLAIDPFPHGGMRNATWRAHVITPGRPCIQCNGQIDGAQVARDRAGLLDNQTYIKTAGIKAPSRENVSLLAPSVTASMLAQFISLIVTPAGLGAPSPLRFSLATHTLEHLPSGTLDTCPYEQVVGQGDQRSDLTARHPAADGVREQRQRLARTTRVRVGRLSQRLLEHATEIAAGLWT